MLFSGILASLFLVASVSPSFPSAFPSEAVENLSPLTSVASTCPSFPSTFLSEIGENLSPLASFSDSPVEPRGSFTFSSPSSNVESFSSPYFEKVVFSSFVLEVSSVTSELPSSVASVSFLPSF